MQHEISVLSDLMKNILTSLAQRPATDPLKIANSRTPEGESEIQSLISQHCQNSPQKIRQRIESEFFGLGPIEEIFSDLEVTEIIINGRQSIAYERDGFLRAHHDHFLSELTFRNFISKISRESGMQATIETPFANGKWGNSRVHIAIPPASGDRSVITIRRHSPSPWTMERLSKNAWASESELKLLQQMVQDRKNLLIVGATGSGKTSVLNACLNSLNPTERAVIIEDTDELTAPNPVSSKLLTRHDAQGVLREIDQAELVKQALRMRPDRLIMGEIRGGEAKDLLMAFATGHSGCMGTLHAESARQALLRLELLVQLGAPQWSLQAVRTLIWLSLHAVAVVGRSDSGKRKLEGIYRISSLEDVGFLVEKA